MLRSFAGVFAVCTLAALALAQGPCPSVGVTVDAKGGRLGDVWRVDVAGAPLVPGFLGLDLAPGPIPTPLGTICLGLTGNLLVHSFLFDAAGAAGFGGLLPPTPVFAGISIYAAALSLDPTLPGGIGVSNGDSFTVREPHFWFVSPGTVSPFGSTPGAIAASHAIGDDVFFSQALTSPVRDAVTVPERNWLVLLLGNGSLVAYDGTTAIPALNTMLTGAASAATKILLLPGGDTVLLLSYGVAPSPFSTGSPGAVHYVSLATGTVSSVSLAAGNPDAMLLVPGTTTVLLRLQNGVVPFDFATAQLAPVISLPSGLGGLVDWQVVGSLLYCLHSGQAGGPFGGAQPAGISVVDVIAQSLLFTSTLGMSVPVQMLRAGPGSAGPALYVYGAAAGAVQEFAQGSVASVTTIPVGSGITAMELSSLGTWWLMVCSGGSCGGPALLGIPVGTTAAFPLSPLPGVPQPALAISPSAGYGKACLVTGTNVATPFGTDPFAMGVAAVLPISSGAFRILSD